MFDGIDNITSREEFDKWWDDMDHELATISWYKKPVWWAYDVKRFIESLWYKPWLRWFGKKLRYQLDVVPHKQLLENLNGDDYWDVQDRDFEGGYTDGPFNCWFVMEIDELMSGHHAPHYYGPFDDKQDAQDHAAYLHNLTNEIYNVLPLMAPTSSVSDHYGVEWLFKLNKARQNEG